MSGQLGITLRGDGSQLKAVLQQAGADVDKFAVQAAGAGAATGNAFDFGTQSAKQLAFNLRGIPMQFTDIFVSLQAGQSPLTVFLQQGGQLKDMFGGIGPAAKALGGYILSLVNPYTAAAAAAGVLGYAWYKGSQEAIEYSKAIVLSGNAAGVTSTQLAASAENMAKSSNISQGAAAEALAMLTRNGNIASADLEKFGATAVNLQKLTGIAVADTVKQFAELGKDPLTATLKLNETTNYLTASVYDQIKALMEQGKTLEAGVVAQHAYMDAMNSRLPQLKENLGLIEKAWGGVATAAKGAWGWMLNLGRDVDPTTAIKQSIAAIEATIADNQKNMAYNPGPLRAENRQLEVKLAMLKEGLSLSQKAESMAAAGAQQTVEQNKALDAKLAFEKTIDQFKEKQVQKQEKLLELQNQWAALKDPSAKQAQDYLKALTLIEEKFKATAPGKIIDPRVAEALKLQTERMNLGRKSAMAFGDEVTKANEEYWKSLEKTTKEQEKSTDAYIKQLDARAMADANVAQAASDYGRTVQEGIARTEIELGLMGQTAQARDIALAQYDIEIKLQKQILEIKKQLASQADEDLAIASLTATAAREKAAVVGKVYADEWKKTAGSINNTLTDALMRGFESGKGFIKNFRDTIVNMFKTMVLRPIISAVMNPIAQGITGALGMSGAASAGTSALGSAAGSLTGLAAVSGAFGTGIAAGFANALTGTFAGSLTAAGSLIGTGTAAGVSAGVGMGLATVLAPVAAVVAVLAAFGAFAKTKQVGGGISGTLGDDSDLSNYETMRRGGSLFRGPKYSTNLTGMDDAQEDSLKTAFIALKGASVDAAKSLGLATTGMEAYTKAFSIEAPTPEKIAAAFAGMADDMAALVLNGVTTTSRTITERVLTGYSYMDEMSAEVWENVTRVITETTSAASIYAKTGETAGATLLRLAGSLTLVNATLRNFGLDLLAVGLAGANTSSKLIDAVGGLEAFAAKTAAYYDSFYSEEEKRANTIRQINEATAGSGLNAATATRAQFRALVESQNITTDAGRAMVNSLLTVAPEFASITEASADAAAGLQGLSDTLKSLLKDRASLEADLLFAADAIAGTHARRAIAIEGFTAVEIAAFDYNATLRVQITALNDAAAAAAALAATNKGWADQLAVLTGAETDRSIALRDATDPTTRALMAQVYAQQDLKTATEAAAATAALAAAAMAAIASQRLGLETQIQQLLGNTATLRARELAALDPSNRALQNHIYALQDTAKAATEATAAVATAKDVLRQAYERESSALQTTIDKVTGSKEAMTQAYERESGAIQTTIDKFANFSKTLKAFRDSLFIGNLSTLSPEEKYRAAAELFSKTSAKAATGDATAIEEMQGVSQAFLDSSREYNASSMAYATDFQKVQTALTSAADSALTQAGVAQAQLTALQSSVSGLITINASVLSVQAAITALTVDMNAAVVARAQLVALTSSVSGLITINTSVISVHAAVLSLHTAIAAQASATSALASANAAAKAATAPVVTAAAAVTAAATVGSVAVSSASNNQGLVISATDSALLAAAKVLYQSATGGVDTSLYNQYLGAVGGASAVGWTGDPAELRAKWGFADGVNSIPYDMTVDVHRGEQIKPSAYVDKESKERAETNRLLKEVLIELRADKTQRGAVGTATIERLDAVATRLDSNKRELARMEK